MDSRFWTVAAVLPAVLLAACSSSGSGNSRSVVITDQPVFADDGTTFEDADGTEFPLLQAFAALDAGNNVTGGGINNDDASLTPIGGGARLKVASLNRDVTFNGDDAEVENGVINLEQPISGGVAHLTLFGDTANLIYSQFGVWEFNWANGAVDAGFWVAGLQTRPDDVPETGTATYNGHVIGGAANGQDAYDLFGDVTMTADFGTGDVNGGFSNMTATNVDDHTVQFPWNDVNFSASIVGGTNTFGGTATTDGTHANPAALSDGTTGPLAGQFFGPQAQEAGGVWTLSDGTVSAAGSFGARE